MQACSCKCSPPLWRQTHRVAGYYKLKRTYAAEMFFFFFEVQTSRWQIAMLRCRPHAGYLQC
eukprot:1084741-Pelagomonas_calceolata.AAC.1